MAKNPAAVALGRKGGKKGGKARWADVSPEQRSEILRKAVSARWERERARREAQKDGTPGPARKRAGGGRAS